MNLGKFMAVLFAAEKSRVLANRENERVIVLTVVLTTDLVPG